MKFPSPIHSTPSLKIGKHELLEQWITLGLPSLASEVSTIKIMKTSRYYLEGFIIFKPLISKEAEDKIISRFYFKLVAKNRYFGKKPVIRHFVSRLSPTGIRNDFPRKFLSIVMPWLQARGYSTVYFPIHSRQRCHKFQLMLREMGVFFHVLNRFFFQIIVVDFDKDGSDAPVE